MTRRRLSYYRDKGWALQVAHENHGWVEEGPHPDPEYGGLTVYWVVVYG